MPKKSTPVRSGAQRSKPKSQKAFELVRPATQAIEESETGSSEPIVEQDQDKTNISSTSTATARTEPVANGSTSSSARTATKARVETVDTVENVAPKRSRGRATEVAELATLPTVPEKKEAVDTEEAIATTPMQKSETRVAAKSGTSTKGSASERLAARRQGTQRASQRNAASLITAEHYSYVKRDLIFIGILALIMVIILIALYFTPGIGI